jgi:translocation and assembly module TamB
VRRIGKALLVVALAMVAAWLGLLVALRTPAAREQISARLGVLLSSERTTVTISALGGSLPFAPTAGVVEIADPRGTWLRIENLRLEIDPWLLPLRHVHVRAASADRVVMWRRPEPDDEPFVLKPVRWLVTAKRVDARAIELGRELLGEENGAELAAPIAAEARGWVDLRRLTLAVELTASTPRLDELLHAVNRGSPISTASARLHVKANGAIAMPGGTVTLSVAGPRRGEIAADGIEIDASVERLGRGDRRYRVTLAARASGLEAPQELAQWVGGAPAIKAVARFGSTPKVFDVDALTLETLTFAAELAGHGREDDSVAISQLAITFPDLRTTPAVAPAFAGGALRVRGSATVTSAWTNPTLTAKVTAEGVGLEHVDADARRIVGPTPMLSATLRYERDRGLTADAVRLVADAFSAEGSGSVSMQGHVEAQAEVEVADVAVLGASMAAPVAGAAVVALEYDGTLDDFDATATLRPQSVRLHQTDPLAGAVVVRARRDRGVIAGEASARLTFGTRPVQADGRYTYDVERGSVRVEALSASLPGIDAEAGGEVQTSPLLVRGRVRARGRDLARAGALLGLALAGEADVSLDLDHDGSRQRVGARGTGRNVRVDDLIVEAVTLDVTPLRAAASRFRVDARGTYRRDFALRAEGSASGSFASADVSVERLDGSYDEYAFATRRALRLVLQDGGMALRDGALDVAGGTVEGVWGTGGLRGVGRVRFTSLPIGLVSLVRERPTTRGRLSGEISRARAGADLEVQARTDDAAVASPGAPGGFARVELDATARVSERRSHVETALGMSDGKLRLDAVVDVPAGIDGADPRGQLAGHVAGAISGEMLGQLFLPEDDRAGGRLDVALDLGGSQQAPTALGRATGSFKYSNSATGMDVRLEQIDLRAEGQRVRIETLKGNDGREGVIDGRGSVDFSAGFADAVYDVEIAFLDTYLARIDEVRLRGDGALHLTGRGREARLTGGFTADEAIVRIPDRLPPEIATIPVEHVNVEMSRNPPVLEEETGPVVPLALDLALQFPGHLRLEDPNLDSEWRGDLFIRGDTNAPDVVGKLTVLRGSFGLGGVQFRAREGALSFDDESNVPTVDITAVANRNEIEATLRLHGRVDRAEIELRSEPPLPQDEILSRLMFGTTATTLTAGQSVQLAQAVARLSGKGPGIDVFGRVRRFVGVDRIEIKDSTDTETGTTTTAVSVGKYLNDRIYVSLDQAVRGEGSKARVEVELTKHISAETEVGQNQNALVGLKWRWNY